MDTSRAPKRLRRRQRAPLLLAVPNYIYASFLASVTVFMRRFCKTLYLCVTSSKCNFIYASLLASVTVFIRHF